MSESILQDFANKFFHRVEITIEFRDRILAGIPRSGDMLDYFLKTRQMSDAEKEDLIVRIKSGTLTDAEKAEMKETAWCCFEKDHEGTLCLWHGNVKAMLREMFTTQGLTQKRPKTANKDADGNDAQKSAGGKQTLQHAVHVDPLRIPFVRDGKPIVEPDGFVDRIKHIEDASGKRSAIGRHDFLGGMPDKKPVQMTFILKWPAKGVFTVDDIKTAMAAAQDDGLGACRSQGMGTFIVTKWKDLK